MSFDIINSDKKVTIYQKYRISFLKTIAISKDGKATVGLLVGLLRK